MKEQRFWFVWNESGNAPRCKHLSEESANREAERLAKANRGQTFFVLALVGGKVMDAVQDIEILERDHDLPF